MSSAWAGQGCSRQRAHLSNVGASETHVPVAVTQVLGPKSFCLAM